MPTPREITVFRLERLISQIEEDLEYEKAKDHPCPRLTRSMPYYIERLEYIAREIQLR